MAIHLVLGGFVIFYFDGTGDAGDSVYHYLIAKYAPVHKTLFFDHWAKPVYVLIASPFAQFGFMGMKIMNLLLVNLTLLFSYHIALKLELKNAILITVFLIFSPLYFVLTFSGLTEPLFAFFLSAAVLLLLKNKLFWSCLLVSFLPYVRSEGLFFIGVFLFFLVFKKQNKWIPVLLTGSLLYGLAGFPVHGSVLWVFEKVPYAKLSSTYGSGNAFHFVEQLVYVIGVPIYILFGLGIVRCVYDWICGRFLLILHGLILGGVIVFILAHSLFWYFGIFNSMGLNRVMIAVLPLIAVVALYGFNVVYDLFRFSYKKKGFIAYLLVIYVIVFPFTSNPAAINFDKELNLNTDQQLAQEVSRFLKQQEDSKFRIITAHPYLCESLDIDYFDENQRKELNVKNLQNLQAGDYIVWENWFAVVEGGIEKETLYETEKLSVVFETRTADNQNKNFEYIVFKVIE